MLGVGEEWHQDEDEDEDENEDEDEDPSIDVESAEWLERRVLSRTEGKAKLLRELTPARLRRTLAAVLDTRRHVIVSMMPKEKEKEGGAQAPHDATAGDDDDDCGASASASNL